MAADRHLVQLVVGGHLRRVLPGGEVAPDVEEGRSAVGEDRDDAHGAEDRGEEGVAHLEHVGVASQQLRADHADGEPREHDHPDEVDAALAHELEDHPGGGEAAGDDQRLRVGLHVAAHQEVDPQGQDGAPDDAGQVLAHRGDQALQTGLGRSACRRLACVLTGGTRLHRFRLLPGFFDVSAPAIRSMTFLEHVLEFLLVVTLFGAAVLAVAFFVARSYIRRHWRLVRGHVITRGLSPGLSFLAAGRERWSARATPEQLSQGTAARVRRRMWTAVEDAEIAVAHADSHDAPVAELPSVCRSLRSAAGELDGLLRHERRLPAGRPPRGGAPSGG